MIMNKRFISEIYDTVDYIKVSASVSSKLVTFVPCTITPVSY